MSTNDRRASRRSYFPARATLRANSALILAGFFLVPTILMSRQQRSESSDSLISAHSTGIFPLPVFYYTPETGFAGGAAIMYLTKDVTSSRPSTITGDVIYTEKKQFVVEALGDQYFGHGRYRLTAYCAFQKYPNNYYGIGNETPGSNEEAYTQRSFRFQAVLYGKVVDQVNIGPAVIYQRSAMLESIPDGQIHKGILPGSAGGTSVGFGVIANWDSRDNAFAAQSGSFTEVTAVSYQKNFGSDFTYFHTAVDLRHYLQLFPDHVLAVQGFAENVSGEAPFQSYPKIGGQNMLRGYFEGRYRDKTALALQAEYRVPVWWRLGVVGFVGGGQVAERIAKLGIDRFWFAGGFGVRFCWNSGERINLRLDYGIGRNSSGVYIKLLEAF